MSKKDHLLQLVLENKALSEETKNKVLKNVDLYSQKQIEKIIAHIETLNERLVKIESGEAQGVVAELNHEKSAKQILKIHSEEQKAYSEEEKRMENCLNQLETL